MIEPRPRQSPLHLGFLRYAREFGIRATGAVLQVTATWSIVRVLTPTEAGIYFEGFILAYGFSGVVRNKYELYLASYIVKARLAEASWPVSKLLYAASRRVLIRSAILCGVFLVLGADLDIQEPNLAPYLETFLPFMLALPFASIAMLFAGVLRAADRSLSSFIISAFAVNGAILLCALLSSPESAPLVLSWAFLAGSIVAAAVGVLLVRRTFPSDSESATSLTIRWQEFYSAVRANGPTGLASAGLQWGPLCVLAVVGPAQQIALLAVIARTAQVLESMLPANYFVACSEFFPLTSLRAARSAAKRWAADSTIAAALASFWLVILLIGAPWLLKLYGAPYTGFATLFTIGVCTHWINAVTRPSVRYMIGIWDTKSIRNALCLSAIAAVSVSLIAANRFGAYAAAAAALVGALLLIGQLLFAAMRSLRASADGTQGTPTLDLPH